MQYPNPAGLKRVRVDRYSRTVYNRVPEPPPRGPKGADRITILESSPTETGGVKAKDFLTGLNLASGLAFGHGGVFVLQAPYLLFYPDRDRDDVPDGDPEVLLSGVVERLSGVVERPDVVLPRAGGAISHALSPRFNSRPDILKGEVSGTR